jgi:hypothetical protein
MLLIGRMAGLFVADFLPSGKAFPYGKTNALGGYD